MKKTVLTSTFLIFLLFLAACDKQDVVFIDNGVENIKVNVEIADTFEKRLQGLMFRESLDDNSGMLFIFGQADYLSFWMKNTLMPLDIIFISENFEIVDIKYAVPCKEDPCISYQTVSPAKYVLEVNGNFTIDNNIRIGNRIMNIEN